MEYVCAFIVMEILRITRQIHYKAVEQRATLIHRQYNRDWGTSYSRPPIDPYLTSPCYKILAAPLGVSDIAATVTTRKGKFIKRYSLNSSVVCEICSLIV